jgi:hypothetical protein
LVLVKFLIGETIMAEVTTSEKQTRVRCSDEMFLEAVFSSKTYAEISEKTGQKISTTMTRFARTKKALSEKGVELPEMERAKAVRSTDNLEAMAEVARRLKASHFGE